MEKNTVTIFLDPQDAKLFIEFQRNHALFELLVAHRVFDIGYGKITMNFANGEIQTISRDEVIYKKN